MGVVGGQSPDIEEYMPDYTAYITILALGLVSSYSPVRSHFEDASFSSFFRIFEVVWPIGLTVGMLLLARDGYRRYQSAQRNDHLVAGWTLAGWVTMLVLGTLLLLHQQSMQSALSQPRVVVSDMGIGGAAFGTIVGRFHVATRDRRGELRSLNQAVEHAGHSVYITDVEGTIEYVNPAFENETGYDAQEAIGQGAKILNSGKHPTEFFGELWDTILAGDVWSGEIINKTKDGELTYVDQTIAPVFDDSGDIERFVAMNNDITEIKEYEQELEDMAEQLAGLNRVIRHDIRNDMNVITGWAQELENHVDDPLAQKALDHVRTSSQNIIELTETAHVFVESLTCEDGVPTKPIRFKPLLEQEITSRREVFPEATIELEDTPDITVNANDMLSSVFRNLINNAIQHNDAEDPTVRVSATVSEPEDSILITVADNGPGIPDDAKDRVFGKGQKFDSSGTGIGLYLVNQLIESYGGEVWVADNDATGSVFNLRIPLA